MVGDALSRLCIWSTTNVEEEYREFSQDMHRLVHLRDRLMDSTEGAIIVTNGSESSLVLEMKEKQGNDKILLDLKGNVHK